MNAAYWSNSGYGSMNARPGGNAWDSASSRAVPGARRKVRQPLPADEPDGEAQLDKTAVAMRLSERLLDSRHANRSYIRSVTSGQLPQAADTSRVPVLGRLFNGREDVPIELDMATMDTSEKRKAERMVEELDDRRVRARKAKALADRA